MDNLTYIKKRLDATVALGASEDNLTYLEGLAEDVAAERSDAEDIVSACDDLESEINAAIEAMGERLV